METTQTTSQTTSQSTSQPASQPDARKAIFKDANFRWLIGGGMLSMLGDQFTLIALPWLVLKMSNDTLILGIVLALISVPRALFILIGGAVVDRYSPKTVMMLTKYINTALLGILSLLLFIGHLELWMVYVLALGLGISTAFSIPSGTSMLPRVVPGAQLQSANGIMLGLRQFTMFIGPVLAGLLIALFGTQNAASPDTVSDAHGLAAAFLFDCFSYAFSAWTLSKVTMNTSVPTNQPGQQAGGGTLELLQSVLAGLRYCWNEKQLRSCFIYWAAIAFFIMGPIQIALPVMANQLSNSASALGLLAGAHGAGTLLGMALSGIRPGLRFGNLGRTILLIDFIVGLLFIPMGLINASWQGAGILLAVGTLGGFLHVAVFTWMQRQVPPQMIGRAMSMFMFIFMGIGPVSAAFTGWLMRSVTIPQLFMSSGILLVAIVLLALLLSPMAEVSDRPTSV
ncbi:MFS transporter [Undibacterium sp. CY18W]|uniref:MFS transporter n=1 Tax=Undibacterium hunanense TaxID=2762292 RepID=A0ABR6ZK80_9BURK|nr:MFS transporter [Undibacterium hunanense]MBC3916321.1 MFS transporter [Undibacterium hunanense]